MTPVDDNGWAIGPVSPWDVGLSWSLVSPQASSRMDEAALHSQAQRFFSRDHHDPRLSLTTPKRYPGGAMPRADSGVLAVGDTLVHIQTMPLDAAPAVVLAAVEGAAAIGGAGFDVLIRRAVRLWQVHISPLEGDDETAPLLLTAVLASIWLAPVVPPGGGSIFGVKGCRERLERMRRSD
jgi:hypothetical protein